MGISWQALTVYYSLESIVHGFSGFTQIFADSFGLSGFSHEPIRVNPWKSAKSVFDLRISASCVCRVDVLKIDVMRDIMRA
ncbi:MAG: hypothetical protein FWG87_00155 [Defluviitaleaceae bacterium]|nr:hypothetical protein [Defluviitaleaceae bacterium]